VAFATVTAALVGCASSDEDGQKPAATKGAATGTGAPPAAGGAASRGAQPAAPRTSTATEEDFARTLAAAERRIDELARTTTTHEKEIAKRRAETESAVEAFAQEYTDRLLAGAADVRDPARRIACVKALAYSNDRRATTAAVAALRVEDDATLQTAAGFALARLRDPDTEVSALVTAARSKDVDVRVNALLAMGRVLEARGAIGNFLDVTTRDQVLPVLETALFDTEDPAVRGWAAVAARQVGDPRILPSLVNLLRDKNVFVRAQTALAVGQYGGRAELETLLAMIDETPVGPARDAVLVAIRRIMGRLDVAVPEDLPDEQASWTAFVRRALADEDHRPVR
jgi:HEAT repeat protein